MAQKRGHTVAIFRVVIISGVFILFVTPVHATTYRIVGEVTETTLALNNLTPIGTPVQGYIRIDSAAISTGLADDPAAILDIGIEFGGFCFAYMESNCTGTFSPLLNADFSTIAFDKNGDIVSGVMSATVFSPLFPISYPVFFDFDNDRFFFEITSLGSASADIAYYRAVPLPATFWFLFVAVFTLVRSKR